VAGARHFVDCINWLRPCRLHRHFAFNYFLGEEFLFRGVLLPKMEGVFGKWDWVANAVLFGLYHIHWAPSILSIIVVGLPGIWLSRRFRCNWMYIVIHGIEGIFLFMSILGVILGMA
jgi:membrane protease YdiL (CAAX protease family)